MTLPIAMLLSGTGRTLENLIAHVRERALPIRIVAVASNKSDVRGVRIAREHAIPVRSFELTAFVDRCARDESMFAWLNQHEPELFCLGGYLALLDLRGTHGKPVLNIHPSLLPAYGGKGFYGDRVHAAVLADGARVSGATVHLVDEVFDRGPIVAQREVPVLSNDDVHSLAARVFAAECELYPSVLRAVAEGRLSFERGRAIWR
jgi:formyltetrahydrofolate-dependent phosphoribosylglycinamide formyltransferase